MLIRHTEWTSATARRSHRFCRGSPLLVCAYAARSRARASSRRSSPASRCCRSAISSRRATGRRLKTGSTRPVACRSSLARICTRRASRSLITRAPRWRKSAENPVASAKERAEAACRRIQATQACVRRRRCLARRSPRAGIRSIDARTSWRRRPAVESAIGTAPFAETGLLERGLFALTAIGPLPSARSLPPLPRPVKPPLEGGGDEVLQTKLLLEAEELDPSMERLWNPGSEGGELSRCPLALVRLRPRSSRS
jgi:hypothetical protein